MTNESKVRVVVNGLHAKSGGGVTYLRHIMPCLQSNPELHVDLVLHEDQRALFGDLGDGGPVHYVNFKNSFYRRLLWEQVSLPFLARRLGAQVTFSPANFGPLFAPGPVILLRNALAVSEVEARPAKRLYWLILSLMTRASLVSSRQAIAVSDYARQALSQGLIPEVLDRIHVVHHGVDPSFSPPSSGKKRENFILCVGDIYIQKNLHALIQALGHVRKIYPDIRLKVAGRAIDDEYAHSVRRLIASNEMADHVEMLGHVDREGLVDLYGRCAVFVQPSTVETFGNPLVEAMACGAPIISSNTTAMPEVLGDAALLVDPNDQVAMAESIVSVLKDKTLQGQLSQKSLTRSKDFSWEKTGRLTAQILKDSV